MTDPRQDTNYSINPWMQDMPIQAKKPAYASYHDQMLYETLIGDMTAPADAIRAIRPPVGNEPFPSRTGYEKHEPTIVDVLSLTPNTLRRDTETRQESGLQGSLSPSMGGW